ncbi:MAG: leucine-rich repeat protein, partial [Thermoguttaceae bacterium]|nr:leucine-rich repeat protein [Thermoguttaceae bacterium]
GNESFCSVDGVLFTFDLKALIRFPEGKSESTYSVPEEVREIKEYAFRNCKSLTVIVFTDLVNCVRENAFSGVPSLEAIEVYPIKMEIREGEEWKNDEEEGWYYSEDGVLFWKKKTRKLLIKHPGGKKNELYVVPDDVTCITAHAFEDCSHVRYIVIPSRETKIEDAAFESKYYPTLTMFAPAESCTDHYATARQITFHQL